MKTYKELYQFIEQHIAELNYTGTPQNLYDPINYMLSLGGKRLRPVLTLMATDLFGGEIKKALPAALAVEVFHNFTLVHDDIMDQAPIRRGKQTVHEKWNPTVAILSGDLMMIKSIDLLCTVESDRLKNLITDFNKAAAEVCEGQQLDMNFENEVEVSSEAYIHMITLKTAVLLGTSLKLGAVIAGASDQDAYHIYEFGKHIGIAFQIQDDILDAFGEGDKVGKKIGGDIAANKKTLLLIEALRLADTAQKTELLNLFSSGNVDEEVKIRKVLDCYRQLDVLKHCEDQKAIYLAKAFHHLEAVSVEARAKNVLLESAKDLMQRMN